MSRTRVIVMGKVFSYQNAFKDIRQKRKLKCKHNKYLKPGALAQHRSYKAMTAKPYTDLGKKRVAVLDDGMVDCMLQSNLIVQSPSMGSPMRASSPIAGLNANHSKLHLKTPKTSVVSNAPSSVLESLPMDILVMLARQFHFNYTTPDRARQELLRWHTPNPTEQWPFKGKGNANSVWVSSPRTPKAPKLGPRPPSYLKYTDMRQIAAVIFQEPSFPSRCLVPSALQRPPCKCVASHRVLFYEEELCQAVAQNKLR